MNVQITEILLEGTEALWVTLNDGLTRLVHLNSDHHFRLDLGAQITPDGQYVRWPGGDFITAEMIGQATADTRPLRLLALFPQQRRYRPVIPLLWGMEPFTHGYLDVRPVSAICTTLGLKASEWEQMLRNTSEIPQDLVLARASDLYLLLSGLFPSAVLPALMRQVWPIIKRSSGSSLMETAAACMAAGRFDLIEYPLIRLLLAQRSEIADVWGMVDSECETPKCPAAKGGNARRQAGGQRGR